MLVQKAKLWGRLRATIGELMTSASDHALKPASIVTLLGVRPTTSRTSWLILVLVLSGEIIAACTTSQTVSLARYTVGSIPDQTVDLKSRVKRLAILHPEYKGREDHKNVARALFTAVGQWPVPLIERSALDKVVQEQAMGMTGLISSDTAARAGRILGADHILTYTVDTTSDEEVSLVDRRGGMVFTQVPVRVINTDTAEVVFQYVGTASARVPGPATMQRAGYGAEGRSYQRLVTSIAAYLAWEAISAAFDRPRLGFLGDAAYTGKGARIFIVIPGSSAEKAGITVGDIVTKFGDRPIYSDGDLDSVLRSLGQRSSRDVVPVNVTRGFSTMTLMLPLGSR